jgi:hypothetical protein
VSDLAGITVDDDQADTDEPRRRRPGGSRRPRPRVRPRGVQAAPENLYPDVAAWVVDFLAPLYAHEWNEMDREWKWCSRWWLHTEAVVRLEAMWKAWELLRLDPGTGASTWLMQHADPAMAALTSPTGTFRRCKPDQHKAYDPLPLEDPPAGMF